MIRSNLGQTPARIAGSIVAAVIAMSAISAASAHEVRLLSQKRADVRRILPIVVPGAHLAVSSPSPIDFGELLVGATATKTLEIRNESAQTLSVVLRVTAPFSIAPPDGAFDLAPGGIRPVDVSAAGEAAVDFTAILVATSQHSGAPALEEELATLSVSVRLPPGAHRADGIGYQGILDAAGLEQANETGIAVDVATLLYQRKECASYYWRSVDTEGILAAYGAQNVKAMVILENFLFRDVNDPVGDDCLPLDPPPEPDPSPCFNDQKWRLVPDWRERLAEFATLHGAHLTPDTVALLLLSSEVNDRCFDLVEVEELANEVRAKFPDLPLAMIYGATHGADGELKSQPPPSHFPTIFDIVGLFSYNLYNVNDPLEPRNATDTFYDPDNPENPLTVYGDLLAKLHPHQKVLLVFDANFGGPKSTLGWKPEDLGEVALNYGQFTSHRPEITILGGFIWQSLLGLPQSVIDIHADLVCNYIENDSPLCGP